MDQCRLDPSNEAPLSVAHLRYLGMTLFWNVSYFINTVAGGRSEQPIPTSVGPFVVESRVLGM